MSNLQQRQEKIQAKRKQTKFRDFVREIASRRPFMVYKRPFGMSRYPDIDSRSLNVIPNNIFTNKYPDGPLIDIGGTSGTFLSDLKRLWSEVPRMSSHIYLGNNENSQRSETVFFGGKNCYLSFVVGESAENILYSSMAFMNVTNILNSFYVTKNSENIYYSRSIRSSYKVFFSKYVYDSSDIWFSTNLLGCNHCIFCDNLENKSYHIYNRLYSKEEFELESRKLLANKELYEQNYNTLRVNTTNKLSTNISNGILLYKCEDVDYGYDSSCMQFSRNVAMADGGDGSSKCFDCWDVGIQSHNLYAVVGEGTCEHLYCCMYINYCNNVYYSYFMQNCSFCLGCIGLKNKSFCILNKKYTKEERYVKVDEIFGQMDRDGTLGEFFPASMNPFYFNDTAAYLIDPSFTKEEVTKLGYLRRDEPIKVDIPEGAITVQSSELAQFESFDEQGNWKLDETVCKRVILDEHGDAYRIIPMELEFLQKHGLPLPRKHWLTRMKENFRIN